MPMTAAEALSPTASRVLDAYGGPDTWRDATAVEATVTFTGFLFRWKSNMPVPRARVRVDVDAIHATLEPADESGRRAVLEGHDVRMEEGDGTLVEDRENARESFSGPKREFKWDDINVAYFMCYACWNYLALPVHLFRDDWGWKELEPGVLEANFAPHVPTHSTVQRYRFGDDGLLERLDYTVSVLGPYARAANVTRRHEVASDGVRYIADRWVKPRLAGTALLPRPTMVRIQVEDYTVVRGRDGGSATR